MKALRINSFERTATANHVHHHSVVERKFCVVQVQFIPSETLGVIYLSTEEK